MQSAVLFRAFLMCVNGWIVQALDEVKDAAGFDVGYAAISRRFGCCMGVEELPVTQTSSSRLAVSMLRETTKPWQPEGRRGSLCCQSSSVPPADLRFKTSGTCR